MNTELMFSSKTDLWTTPRSVFDELDKEFNFTLDTAANDSNAKCSKYFTALDDGLRQDWSNNIVFCNPPYGKQLKDWVRKAYEESLKPNTLVVLLIPARTDTKYFHDFILGKASIRFIKGRLKFGDSKNAAPFPSMIIIYNSKELTKTIGS